MGTEFGTIGARRIYGDECRFHSNKPNRNVTMQSLIAFFQLLETENQEDFCVNYLIAFHDNNGPTVWNLMDYKYQNKWNHKVKERKLAKKN